MKERFCPRGIGRNWLRCFICGGPEGPALKEDGVRFEIGVGGCQADIASYVEGRAGGLRVQAMFVEAGLHAFLDYRPNEPGYVQLKLGACKEHLPNLERLGRLTSQCGGWITPEIILAAVTARADTEA